MGDSLVAAKSVARETLAEADDLLGFSLSSLIHNGPEAELTDTINAQPAILAVSVALLRCLPAGDELRPAYVAGHSLGEYSALVCAGALSFADGLRLVRERGRLMKKAGEQNPGGMAAILGLQREPLADLCQTAAASTGRPVGIANDNCPGQIVISGSEAALDAACRLAEEQGAKRVVRLPVSIASHSPLMAGAAAEFQAAVDAASIQAPTIPVIGNTSARPLGGVEDIRAELVRQLTGPVCWTESIGFLLEQGVDTFAEIGPKDVLTGLMKRIDRKATRLSVQDAENIAHLVEGA